MSDEPSDKLSGTTAEPDAETAESLERSGKQYAKIWIGQRLQRIGIGAAFAVFAIVGLFFLKSCTDTFADHNYNGVAEHVIGGPRTLMGFLVVGAVIIAFVIGIGMTFVQVGKILLGPPKAAKTAEKTVRQFYKCAIVHAGTIDSGIDLAAFVCLLDRAKRELGEWKGFCDYWKKINNDIVQALRERSKHPVTKTSFEVKNVGIQDGKDGSASYIATISFSVISGVDNPPFSSSKTLGPYLYTAKGDLVRVGERWYLCSGKWSGVS